MLISLRLRTVLRAETAPLKTRWHFGIVSTGTLEIDPNAAWPSLHSYPPIERRKLSCLSATFGRWFCLLPFIFHSAQRRDRAFDRTFSNCFFFPHSGISGDFPEAPLIHNLSNTRRDKEFGVRQLVGGSRRESWRPPSRHRRLLRHSAARHRTPNTGGAPLPQKLPIRPLGRGDVLNIWASCRSSPPLSLQYQVRIPPLQTRVKTGTGTDNFALFPASQALPTTQCRYRAVRPPSPRAAGPVPG